MLLQLNLWQDIGSGHLARPGILFPLGYESGWIAAERDGIDLNNVDGSVPYYLYHFRAPVDPFIDLETTHPGMGTVPPYVDLLRYNQTTPGKVDYVLLFGRAYATPQVMHATATRCLEQQLAAAYAHRSLGAAPREGGRSCPGGSSGSMGNAHAAVPEPTGTIG